MKIIFIFILSAFSIETVLIDAVYNIIYNNSYLNYDLKNFNLSETLKEEINSNFRLKKISSKNSNSNISFYNIEHVFSNKLLYFESLDNLNLTQNLSNIHKNLTEWNFIPTKNNKFIIQNKNKCYLKVKDLNITYQIVTCQNININEASEFLLIKIYEEVKHTKEDIELIEKEPIDMVIKYIDFIDSSISFKGLPTNKPKFDDEELKYCIRSILKNIPWIRKIYILMPNDKVRYFKEYEYIKNKIIYIKEKDIYGSNNYNWLAFKFRYWKLKKYNLSDNFIAMDYNNFIGTPLRKSDFFYVSNGTITPAIITNKFVQLRNFSNPNLLNNELKKNVFKLCTRLSTLLFKNSLYNTYLYIIKLFNQTNVNFAPAHNFNAIPLNIKELDEICDIVSHSEYRHNTLYSMIKNENSLQFQAFVLSYGFIKYKKKVKNIPIKLINNRNPILPSYNISLFSFFTEEETCEQIYYQKAKIILEYLFGKESPYERPIINNTFHILAYNTVYEIDREYREYKSERNNYTKQLNDELKSVMIEIECYEVGFVLSIFCYLIYKKFIIRIKNIHNLKGYIPFTQNENE